MARVDVSRNDRTFGDAPGFGPGFGGRKRRAGDDGARVHRLHFAAGEA